MDYSKNCVNTYHVKFNVGICTHNYQVIYPAFLGYNEHL
jgi:hypothetical protein